MQLRRLKQYCAFTIMELVIVVTMVGVMAAFIIPNYRGTVDRANEKAAVNNLRIIYAAQQMRNNTGAGYYYTFGAPCNAGDTQNINNNLNLSVLNDGFNYCCTNQGAITLSCIAFGATFNVLMTNANTNVCCSNTGGACPTLPASQGNPESCP